MFQWLIIGAGPAGILSVGKLIDQGVAAEEIAWVDPFFQVGDLGRLWSQVPSNTLVRLFTQFLRSCQAFEYELCTKKHEIHRAEPQLTCPLRLIVEPLQWISDHLRRRVHAFLGRVDHLVFKQRGWQVFSAGNQLLAKNIVLAIGSDPKVLHFEGLETVPLQDAIVRRRLSSLCCSQDVFAVFGSSHSAVLVLKNLVELGIKRIINFYQSPMRYAIPMEGWTLFDNTGLKGQAAEWARAQIDGECPDNLLRLPVSTPSIHQYLSECHKVVYAIGFSRRSLPVIHGMETIHYDEQTGIIAPGLFGIGIAFPELVTNPVGIKEYAVGLSKFTDYIDRVMPVWLKYGA